MIDAVAYFGCEQIKRGQVLIQAPSAAEQDLQAAGVDAVCFQVPLLFVPVSGHRLSPTGHILQDGGKR